MLAYILYIYLENRLKWRRYIGTVIYSNIITGGYVIITGGGGKV